MGTSEPAVTAPAELVRRLYERYQDRDWAGASVLLHDDASVQLPATAERLAGREQVLAMQRDYPEPWGDLTVRRVVGDGVCAAAELEVTASAAVFRCAAFWDLREGLLHRGVEYWVTVGAEEPPPDRAAYRAAGS